MAKLLTLLLAALTLNAQADRFGLPACSAPNEELADRTYFILCHNAQTRTPSWVAYELAPAHLGGSAKRPSHFRADHQLEHPGATNADYTNSGYSRGHLAPAADFSYSDDAMRTTFLLSNAAPQDQRVNAGVWSQLERHVRLLASQADAVYVVTGPLYQNEPETIGPNQVAVPDAFFKAILVVKNNRATTFAAIVANHPASAANYETTIRDLERATKLHFFTLAERH